jgi:NADH-quinone oxidoreductase subunit F
MPKINLEATGMDKPLTQNIHPNEEPFDRQAYEGAGGYQAVRKVIKEMQPNDVIELVKASNLRGRGGAGFPTGMKWSFVPSGDRARHPTYLIMNADEMEPGTFKDRLLLEGDPNGAVEAMIAAAYAIQADVGYIFLRWAYKLAERRLQKAIQEAYQAGYLGKNILGSGFSFDLYVHSSAGRYMCGEETGLLNSLEGKRATPRFKPPFPQVSGLWGQPSVVNNVETLYNVPHIINRGAAWFRDLSISTDGGTKLYGASGKVNHPGVWELPMGTSIREILEEHAGGMRAGFQARAVQPGGGSTDFVAAENFDLPMDFNSLQKVGSRMGTGTLIVMDDKTCPVAMVQNLEVFYAQESCGWCTPCREGLPWTARLLKAIDDGQGQEGDLEILAQQAHRLGPGYTFCAHAPGAAEPLQSALRLFHDDFERHITEQRCPWR